jgi:hypothetical protein
VDKDKETFDKVIPTSAIDDLLVGIEEGAALAPNARGWRCRDVRSTLRKLR